MRGEGTSLAGGSCEYPGLSVPRSCSCSLINYTYEYHLPPMQTLYMHVQVLRGHEQVISVIKQSLESKSGERATYQVVVELRRT